MNEIEVVVKSTDKSDLTKVRASAKAAGDAIGNDLKRGFKEAETASGNAQREIGKNLDKTKAKAGESGKSAGREFGTQFGENVQESVGGNLQGITEGLLEKVKGGGGVAAAGAGVGLVLVEGITTMLEQGNIGGVVAAQIEGGGSDAGRMGKLAGQVYAANFGDSLEQAGEAIKAIIQNKLLDRSATDDAIRHTTEMVLTAGKVTGEEANNIARAARQMLVNGLAQSSDEAFDLIVAASQRGLNVNQDLIDTIVEYGTKFRDLGLTGQQALGLIAQAMDAGARDTDFAADALKEFAIRAQDGSATTVRGFETIGLNAKEMGLSIAAGGDRAHDALGKTLNGLRSIEDPVKRNQAAVDLFGAKAEDLGQSLYAMNLDTVAGQLDNVAGATSRASDTMTTAGAKAEGFFRQVKQGASDAAGWLVSGFKSVFGGNSQDLMDLVVGTQDYTNAQQDNAQAQKDRAREAATAWTRERDQITMTTVTLDENIRKHKEAMGGVMSLAESEIRFESSLDKAATSLKENGKNLDIHTEKGRNNKQALLDVADAAYRHIDAMEKQGATAPQVTEVMGAARDQFVSLATKMGMSAVEAEQLATKLRLVPGDYVANVTANTSQANNAISYTRDLLNLLHDKTINLTVNERQIISQEARFGAMPTHAAGGIVGAGPVLARQGGGPGHSAILQNEQGGEIAMHPDGTMIIPAGMSRQIMAGAFARDRSETPPRASAPDPYNDDRIVQLLVNALERVTVTLDGRTVGLMQGRQASLLGRTG